jgi:hypothetical protein
MESQTDNSHLPFVAAADLPGYSREHGASERGSRRFFLAMRRDLRGDTTEGIS